MKKTFFAKAIALSDIENATQLASDYKLFGKMMCAALTWKHQQAISPSADEPTSVEPITKGRRSSKPSCHTFLKDEYQASDYFVTSVEAQVNGKIRSAQESFNHRIDNSENRIKSLKNRIQQKDKKIANLMKVKQSLIDRTRSKTAIPPPLKTYKGCNISTRDIFCEGKYSRTEFTFFYYSKRAKKHIVKAVYNNDYLFETQYVDSKIRTLKQERNQIAGRLHNEEKHLASLIRIKDQNRISCNLVSMNKQRKWRDSGVKDIKTLIKNHRCTEMVLAGRHDAKQGNFMVRYDIETHTLRIFSTSMGAKIIVIPNVEFLYGQDYVEKAVSANKKTQKSVAWGIRIYNTKVQVTCICETEVPAAVTDSICYGAVGLDKNYNNLAITETNEYGCRINSKSIFFDLEKGSSRKNENTLSEALEDVFKYCVAVKKPLVCEDIKNLKHETLYQSKKRNRKIGMFAYRKMDALIDSKAVKYGVQVIKVNPAYTSVIGRYKYAPMYHISVHSAASFVIARRGQGFEERIPKYLRQKIKKENNITLTDWKTVSKIA